jgi:opacity protein-like surface antigen
MKSLLTILILLTLTNSYALAGEFSGNVSGYLGQKEIDDDRYNDRDLSSYGVISDFKMSRWPVSIAVDSFASLGDIDTREKNDSFEVDTDTRMAELHVGIRKIWNLSDTKIYPYIGGGLTYISVSTDRSTDGSNANKDSDSDRSSGTWIGVGVYWHPITHLNMGIDVRSSDGDVALFGEDLEAGGIHAGLFMGYHW